MPSDTLPGAGLLFGATPRVVYFVCGSRSLDGNPWGRQYIEQWLPQAARAMVMTGGARGPDSTALSVGGQRGLETLAVFSDGYAMSSAWSGSKPWSWLYDLLFPEPEWARIEGKKRPLARNAFMAYLLGSMQNRANYTVMALALCDPNSNTGGTRHMIRCLVDAGVGIETIVAP